MTSKGQIREDTNGVEKDGIDYCGVDFAYLSKSQNNRFKG